MNTTSPCTSGGTNSISKWCLSRNKLHFLLSTAGPSESNLRKIGRWSAVLPAVLCGMVITSPPNLSHFADRALRSKEASVQLMVGAFKRMRSGALNAASLMNACLVALSVPCSKNSLRSPAFHVCSTDASLLRSSSDSSAHFLTLSNTTIFSFVQTQLVSYRLLQYSAKSWTMSTSKVCQVARRMPCSACHSTSLELFLRSTFRYPSLSRPMFLQLASSPPVSGV